MPLQIYLGGDYDPDDYDAHKHDGDNDDRTGPRDHDNDADNPSSSYYDGDDQSVLRRGRAVDPASGRAVAQLVIRYFRAAAEEDGKRGCAMIVASLARSVPETLGRPPGPPYLKSMTCAGVMSKVYRQNHRQLAIYAATLEVASVGLTGDEGLAVLRIGGLPGRQVRVAREAGEWKIQALLDEELP